MAKIGLTHKCMLLVCVLCCVSLCNQEKYNLGKGYYYVPENRHILSDLNCYFSTVSKPKPDIPPEIKRIVYDRDVILVMQNPGGRYNCGLYNCPSVFPGSLDSDYYWLIDKRSDQGYGPYLKDDFTKVCDSLGIRTERLFYDTGSGIVHRVKSLVMSH
ncbi:MAG: DUF3997 domain-containing protein [Bacteroidales bacterium]|nr:DUF3997 domain-containing protein [Bacteroidales bacterium]MCQ2115197.1 DUF3997 domain-containing protein [Bacteroidales bacterium]